MKALMKYSLIITALAFIMLTGCEKDFDEINKNPNQSLDAATPALLSQAIRDYGFNDFDVWYIGRQSGLAAQHISQRNYTSEDRYSFRVNVTDGFFRNNYIWMTNLQKIVDLNTDPLTKEYYGALYGDNQMQIAIAEIMKCWVFQLLTDYFGDIPYSEALNVLKFPQPKYDSQKDVYDGLIATLNNAQTALENSTTAGFETGDLFFKGDLSQWIKFANSLRLKVALRASNADPTYLDEALDAITDGVMESNDDNAMCAFSTSGAPNEAPWYNGLYVGGRNDFTFTYRFIELLRGNDHLSFVNPFNGIVDPRYKVFTTYDPATSTARFGVPYGMTDNQTQQWWGVTARRFNIYSSNPVFVRPDFPSTFLDYSTVCFMASEVNNWDATWFENGVVSSLEKWEADPIQSAAYVTAIMTKFNDAGTTTEMKKEMVITQKYIHLLTQSHEAWFEYRRTGYPKSLVKPGDVTVNIGGDDVFFTPVSGSESGSDVVARFKYPSSEFTLNKENVEAAVARMGEDTHKQKVWWAGGGTQ